MLTSLLARTGVAVAIVVGLGGGAAGQLSFEHAHEAGAAYAGVRLVRVMPTSREQYEAASSIARSVWTHRPAPGRALELLVDDAGVERLRDLGLSPETLIDDVQGAVDAQMRDIEVRSHERGLSFFQNYHDNDGIRAHIDGLAAAYPEFTSTSVFGLSIQGRDLYQITITAPDAPGNLAADRPVVILNGCQHAREWVSPATVTFLADQLLERYSTDPRVQGLVDSVRIVIVPMVNPDGYVYTWGPERLWRKNRRGGFGVDLNRNWGYEWGGQGSSGFTGDEIYRGTAPFSEPETAALRDLALSFGEDLVAHIDYHSFSQLILWPFGYADGVQTPEPDRTRFDELSTAMSSDMVASGGQFYSPIQSIDLYAAAGASADWFYGELGATSFAIELRDTGFFGFLLPADQILPTAQENFVGLLTFLEGATQLLSFNVAAPAQVQSGQTHDLDFQVREGAGTLNTSSVTAYTRVGAGAFNSAPATPLGGDSYRLTLPAAACGSTIDFYVTADTTGGQTLSFPVNGASDPLSTVAYEITTVIADNFETNTGWTVSGNVSGAASGQWERAIPGGDGSRGDPASDADGSGRCYITGNGGPGSNTDVDGGSTILTSPALDLSATPEASVRYWRWYNNAAGAAPGEDVFVVEISSNNGGSWTTLETVGPTGAESSGGWYEAAFRVADFVTPSAQVRVRFTASDLGSGSVVEAGVDGFGVDESGCSGPTPCSVADLAEPFGALDFSDVVAFLSAFGSMDPAADLAAPIGVFDFSDVVAFLSAFGAGCP